MGAWFTSEMYIWQNFGTFQLNFPPSHLSKYDIPWNFLSCNIYTISILFKKRNYNYLGPVIICRSVETDNIIVLYQDYYFSFQFHNTSISFEKL